MKITDYKNRRLAVITIGAAILGNLVLVGGCRDEPIRAVPVRDFRGASSPPVMGMCPPDNASCGIQGMPLVDQDPLEKYSSPRLDEASSQPDITRVPQRIPERIPELTLPPERIPERIPDLVVVPRTMAEPVLRP